MQSGSTLDCDPAYILTLSNAFMVSSLPTLWMAGMLLKCYGGPSRLHTCAPFSEQNNHNSTAVPLYSAWILVETQTTIAVLQYLAAFGNIAKAGNTMLLPSSASDPATMVAQALSIYNNVSAKAPFPGGCALSFRVAVRSAGVESSPLGDSI